MTTSAVGEKWESQKHLRKMRKHLHFQRKKATVPSIVDSSYHLKWETKIEYNMMLHTAKVLIRK